jgi:hypothetical protein
VRQTKFKAWEQWIGRNERVYLGINNKIKLCKSFLKEQKIKIKAFKRNPLWPSMIQDPRDSKETGALERRLPKSSKKRCVKNTGNRIRLFSGSLRNRCPSAEKWSEHHFEGYQIWFTTGRSSSKSPRPLRCALRALTLVSTSCL